MANNDSLGNRMKAYYEDAYRLRLTRRTPAIIRIDGKAFHSFTRGFDRPFDKVFHNAMWETTKYLCENIQNARVAYTQSDEISILMIDYDKFTTSAWFDANIQKIASVSASMATMAFNKVFQEELSIFATQIIESKTVSDEMKNLYNTYCKRKGLAIFDARVFNLPEPEVCNYFIWRQQDATRNSIEMLGRCHFSSKQLHKVNCSQIQEKLLQEKGINWDDYPTCFKQGVCIVKNYKEVNGTMRSEWVVDPEIPKFTDNRNYIEKFMEITEK